MTEAVRPAGARRVASQEHQADRQRVRESHADGVFCRRPGIGIAMPSGSDTGEMLTHRPESQPPLRLVLRDRTADLHLRAERSLGVPATLTSLERYRSLLMLLLGFYAPLERALARFTQWSHLGLAVSQRYRTPLLAADLTRLEVPLATVPACRSLPQLSSFDRAVGAMYVMEGATLGGRVVVRVARSKLGPIPGSFFDGYGLRTATMWREFTDALAKHDAAGADRDEVVTGAIATFRSLESWIDDAGWSR